MPIEESSFRLGDSGMPIEEWSFRLGDSGTPIEESIFRFGGSRFLWGESPRRAGVPGIARNDEFWQAAGV